jgi:hypothetical protein
MGGMHRALGHPLGSSAAFNNAPSAVILTRPQGPSPAPNDTVISRVHSVKLFVAKEIDSRSISGDGRRERVVRGVGRTNQRRE